MYCKECNLYIKNHRQHTLSKNMISFKNISVDIMEFKKQLIGPTKNMCIIKLVYLAIQNS